MIEHTGLVQAISEQEIGEGRAARSARRGIARGPAAVEGEGAAGDIRLRVVVVSLYELAAKAKFVATPNPSQVGREIGLCVVIGDEALTLGACNARVLRREAGRERRPGCPWNFVIIGRWPAVLSQVEIRIGRGAEIVETAAASDEVQN